MSSFFRVHGNRVKIIFQYIFFADIQFSGHVYEIVVPYIHIFFFFNKLLLIPEVVTRVVYIWHFTRL